jgi:eukaryotic-like serine/threonine-protein kinase
MSERSASNDTVDIAATGAELDPRGSTPAPLLERLGRYLVVSQLGSGAQGVVYRAYDPDLDRKVAIKLLRPEVFGAGDLEKSRLRVLREAQAMARLSHPNVVPIHDVGTAGDRLFVAMEYIDGQTLRQWLKQAPRSAEQILEKFLHAGRGIAAAHAAGLLHRDFKPENVLVDGSGQVKVTDFGLARAVDAGAAPLSESVLNVRAHANLPDSSPLDQALTQAGALLGTPAFMAPEQFLGLTIDARTEQFNFCASLWEALYGQRAFAGDTYETLAASVTCGEVRGPADERGVPARIRGVLLRGLSREREHRFDTFEALLTELSRDPRRERRPWLLAGATVAALAVATGSVALWSMQRPEPCPDPRPQMAQVWNAEEWEQLRGAFTATGAVMADFAAQKVGQMFDDYANTWAAVASAACRDARVLGVRPVSEHERQVSCLERRLATVRHTVASLKSVDARSVGRAQQAVLAIPRVEACLDPAADEISFEARGAARAEQLIAIQDEVDRVRADFVLGLSGRVLEDAPRIAERAAAIGHLAAQAEAVYVLGVVQGNSNLNTESVNSLQDAIRLAEEAGLDALRARGLMSLSFRIRRMRVADAQERSLRSADWAEAVIRRMQRQGKRVDDLYATLHNSRSFIYFAGGDYERAVEAAGAALRHLQAAPDVFIEAQTLERLAYGLLYLGRPQEALTAAERGVVLTEEIGSTHPRIAMLHLHSAAALSALGRHPEAERAALIASDIFEKAFGANSPNQMLVTSELANAVAARDLVAAERIARRGIEFSRRPDAPPGDLHCQQAMLGTILLEAGRPGEAVTAFAEAIEEAKKAMGEDHPDVAEAHAGMGLAQEALGNRAEAERHFRRALDIFDRKFGPQNPSLIRVLSGLGRTRLAAGAADEAQPLLERALAVPPRPMDAPHLGRAQLALAELAWKQGEGQTALRLARLAREQLATWRRDGGALGQAEATLARLEER